MCLIQQLWEDFCEKNHGRPPRFILLSSEIYRPAVLDAYKKTDIIVQITPDSKGREVFYRGTRVVEIIWPHGQKPASLIRLA